MGSYWLNSTSFGVGTTQTSAEVGWSTSDGYSGTFTVWFPTGVSSPSQPSVSIAEIYETGAKFNVSVSSYGSPSDSWDRYIEAGILAQNSYGNSYRYQIAYRANSATITVDNSSRTGSPSLTIAPNTRYWYGGWVTNTEAHNQIVSGQFVTKAHAPTVSLANVTDTTASFSYSTSADGGYYNKTIQYSVDGGSNWVTAATVTGGSAASGTFTISNLLSGAAYDLKTRVSTTTGVTYGATVSFNTVAVLTDKKLFYGPVNDEAKIALDIYGGVSDAARRVNKLYGAVEGDDYTIDTFSAPITSFDISLFRQKLADEYPSIVSPTRLDVGKSVSNWHIDVRQASGPGWGIISSATWAGVVAGASQWGITLDSVEPPDDSYETIATFKTIQMVKTKLIHQGFGHFPYYGQIVYYTDAGHTDTGVILLKSQSQIDQLHGNWQGWEIEIEGVQLNSADIKEVYIGKQAESIPQAFLTRCSSIDTVDLSESEITSIPINFLSYCSNFNGTLKLPPTTQTIGSLFLYEAKHFNQPLTIPTGVTSINYNFLYNASDFNQPITLPPSLVSLGYQFLYGCNMMTSTVNVGSLSADIATDSERTFATNSSSAAMYTTGVTIAGSNRAAWLAKFPNSNSVPFRKLVDAGY